LPASAGVAAEAAGVESAGVDAPDAEAGAAGVVVLVDAVVAVFSPGFGGGGAKYAW
jgi:hypothetical protein